jgi:putative ABC transport system ATP-binding protein
MAPTPVLQASHVSKKIMSGNREINVLCDINLTVQPKQSTAILGVSGSGKTTLLSLLAGLDTPSSGKIELHQHNLIDMTEDARAILRRQHVGFIFQSFELLPALTAIENVMLPLDIQSIPYTSAKMQAIEWLTRLGLAERLDHYPHQLSGGEQQRVAIARAFVVNPSIIFADEITGNLDEKTGEAVIETLFELIDQNNTTVILTTHDKNLASHCSTQLKLKDGVLHPL